MSKEDIQKVLDRVLPEKATISNITLAGEGYHSRGYKVETDRGTYFVKRLTSRDRGFEFPERKIFSLLVSHGMNARTQSHPRSLGIVTMDHKETNMFTHVDYGSKVFEVQEFAGETKTLLEGLKDRAKKTALDREDLNEIRQTIDFITKLHSTIYDDKKHANAVYNDYLRAVIGHPEYTLQLLHTFEKNDPILPEEEQKILLGKMLHLMQKWKDHGKRLRALHGDFWISNCIKRPDGTLLFIDYSRMPWGDPGFDIGFWTSTFAVDYIQTRSPYFLAYLKEFLRQYLEKTGDKEILRTMVYPYAVISIMYASSFWVPGFTPEERKDIYAYCMAMLEKGEFIYPDAVTDR